MILATITSTISALVGLTALWAFFSNQRKAHDARIIRDTEMVNRLASIEFQVNNNHGSSMKDTVDNIWKSVNKLDAKLERHLGYHAALGEHDA